MFSKDMNPLGDEKLPLRKKSHFVSTLVSFKFSCTFYVSMLPYKAPSWTYMVIFDNFDMFELFSSLYVITKAKFKTLFNKDN